MTHLPRLHQNTQSGSDRSLSAHTPYPSLLKPSSTQRHDQACLAKIPQSGSFHHPPEPDFKSSPAACCAPPVKLALPGDPSLLSPASSTTAPPPTRRPGLSPAVFPPALLIQAGAGEATLVEPPLAFAVSPSERSGTATATLPVTVTALTGTGAPPTGGTIANGARGSSN